MSGGPSFPGGRLGSAATIPTESRIFADRYLREMRRREALHAARISPGTKTWTDALAALYARMGQSGSPTKQAAVLHKATTYLISDKSEGGPHMTMFGHWGASRSAFLCFATFSAGAHPLIGVDEQGINIAQHLISCERSGGARLISDIDLACNKQTLGLRCSWQQPPTSMLPRGPSAWYRSHLVRSVTVTPQTI